MNLNEIKTPPDVYSFIDENIQYGWLDIEGNIHCLKYKNKSTMFKYILKGDMYYG